MCVLLIAIYSLLPTGFVSFLLTQPNQNTPPDGCPDFVPIAPPSNPIAPPSIINLTLEDWIEDGTHIQDLTITLIHPEANHATTWTKLTQTTNPQRQTESHWQFTNSQWPATCGDGDAQLTWATLAYLNRTESNPWRIYTASPPAWFLQRLTNLQTQALTEILYLPLIASSHQPITQLLPAPEVITATRTSYRCYSDSCIQLRVTFAAQQPNSELHFIIFERAADSPIWVVLDESRNMPTNESRFATAVMLALNGDPSQLHLYDVSPWLLALL
jgi:hypothetical protein